MGKRIESRMGKSKGTWGWWEYSLFVFFVTHIPITLSIDAQSVVPREFFPQAVVRLVDWYYENFDDPFYSPFAEAYTGRTHPQYFWFRVIIFGELFFQLPFFFYAIWAMWNCAESFRGPAIFYGSHVALTVYIILAYVWLAPTMTIPSHKLLRMTAVYMPYFIFPLGLAVRMIFAAHAFPRSSIKQS
mmetsp:Transcript_31719/g.88887  ORF Transcript_31719/g.88887 Transcript_31719/m.88887 type:complete len:187 (+) Transcript_31719:237-797(+)